jgi:hypothetical protein
MIEEKKQREHLLQLNQILAKQVMEMSKIVAGENLTYFVFFVACVLQVVFCFCICFLFIGTNSLDDQ